MIGIVYSFQKLNVWQEAKLLMVDVYHLLDGAKPIFPIY